MTTAQKHPGEAGDGTAESSDCSLNVPLQRRSFLRVGAFSTAATGLLTFGVTTSEGASAATPTKVAAIPATNAFDITSPAPSFGNVGSAPSKRHHPVSVDWISTFQSGHGFTVENAVMKDDSDHSALGDQSVQIATNSPMAYAQITKTGLVVNTSDRHIILWIRIENFGEQADATRVIGNRIAAIELLLGTPGFGSFFTLRTWINGESITPALNGEWFPLRFDWATYSTLTADSPPRNGLTDLRLRFITSTNVSAASNLVVNVGGIGTVPVDSTRFPNGVVSFTFDDAYADAYTQGKRILDKYGFAGTAYVISQHFGEVDRLTLGQARAMQEISGWEIGGHCLDVAAHDNRLASLSAADLEAEISGHKAWLRSNGFRGESFAYPGGVFTQQIVEVVGRYFSSARTTSSQPFHNHPERLDPYLLTHCDSSVAGEVSAIKQRLNEAKANNLWLILTHHRISSSVGLPPSEFESIVDHAASIGIAVRTVQDVVCGL